MPFPQRDALYTRQAFSTRSLDGRLNGPPRRPQIPHNLRPAESKSVFDPPSLQPATRAALMRGTPNALESHCWLQARTRRHLVRRAHVYIKKALKHNKARRSQQHRQRPGAAITATQASSRPQSTREDKTVPGFRPDRAGCVELPPGTDRSPCEGRALFTPCRVSTNRISAWLKTSL